MDRSSWTPQGNIEMTRLVQRLININYLLKREEGSSAEVRACLQIADGDLARLKVLVRQVELDS
jgi:hypothetical protein